MAIRRTSHAVYDICYHMVWCPKYRKQLFGEERIRERAGQLLQDISEENGWEMTELEVAREHVHLLLSCLPRYAIGEVVRILKSKSARALFREVPGLRRKLWAEELWEGGYFVRTVGNRMTGEVIDRCIPSHRELKQGPEHLELKLR